MAGNVTVKEVHIHVVVLKDTLVKDVKVSFNLKNNARIFVYYVDDIITKPFNLLDNCVRGNIFLYRITLCTVHV